VPVANGTGSETEDMRRIDVISSSRLIRLAIRHPNASGAGSQEDLMSTIVLSEKGAKLMKLCDVEGLKGIDDLLALSVADSVCPAICMTEGCDHIAPMESDQEEGYCEA